MLAQGYIVFNRFVCAAEHGAGALNIELSLPTGEYDGGHYVANDVGDGAYLLGKPVDSVSKIHHLTA